LAKWTIANGFQQPPGSPLFLQFVKSPLRAEDDGISTEPDTWKGLEVLIDFISISCLALKFCAGW
jgi:hypothetical protein